MGRHRRSGAAPAAEDYAAGSGRRHRGDRRKRRVTPVRTGLLGATAAVAVGAAAVASGLLPGGDTFTVGSTATAERPASARQAPELTTQGGSTRTPAGESGGTGGTAGTGAGTGSGGARTASPSAKPSAKPSGEPSAGAGATPSAEASAKQSAEAAPRPTPSETAPAKPVTPEVSVTPSTEPPAPTAEPTPETPAQTAAAGSTADRADAAEAEVLRLVNVERAKVGCSPVSADARLAQLAGAFSADMEARNFFDHTDPDGATPWIRAEKAGIANLAGENIARGQVDAAAVMTSWMNSDGHRANILNCEFTTLGVGVEFGDGGPWWTQNFGR
ncbi:CAP domain-containing protein [Streptomyces sp. NPDC020807]|uniref:CAP domain-containing protein n=1 Tax=Streptomyces sp. NPDC020807 TaxID=3155119 RepID=UPI0033C51E34